VFSTSWSNFLLNIEVCDCSFEHTQKLSVITFLSDFLLLPSLCRGLPLFLFCSPLWYFFCCYHCHNTVLHFSFIHTSR